MGHCDFTAPNPCLTGGIPGRRITALRLTQPVSSTPQLVMGWGLPRSAQVEEHGPGKQSTQLNSTVNRQPSISVSITYTFTLAWGMKRSLALWVAYYSLARWLACLCAQVSALKLDSYHGASIQWNEYSQLLQDRKRRSRSIFTAEKSRPSQRASSLKHRGVEPRD